MKLLALLPAALALTPAAFAQTPAPAAQRIQVTLERLESSAWRALNPALVLESGDRVRFRFKSNFDGYLYVMNRGTSGAFAVLFPQADTGRDNAVAAGREYVVPATQALFRIAGPPGHDIVYWLVSPVPLGAQGGHIPLPPPPKSPPPPQNLSPRCDESMLRARGLCIDSSAGPRTVPEAEALPENLAAVPGARSRELVVMRRQTETVFASPQPLTGPVIYEFRLAHR